MTGVTGLEGSSVFPAPTGKRVDPGKGETKECPGGQASPEMLDSEERLETPVWTGHQERMGSPEVLEIAVVRVPQDGAGSLVNLEESVGEETRAKTGPLDRWGLEGSSENPEWTEPTGNVVDLGNRALSETVEQREKLGSQEGTGTPALPVT